MVTKEKLKKIKLYLDSEDIAEIADATNLKQSTIRTILNGNRFNLTVLKKAKELSDRNKEMINS